MFSKRIDEEVNLRNKNGNKILSFVTIGMKSEKFKFNS